MTCANCGRPRPARWLVKLGQCGSLGTADCWRARAERLEAERDALKEDLAFEKENVERMAKVWIELNDRCIAAEADRDRWLKERADIGLKFDLHRLSASKERGELKHYLSERVRQGEMLRLERDEAVGLLRRWNKSTTTALCNATADFLVRIAAKETP